MLRIAAALTLSLAVLVTTGCEPVPEPEAEPVVVPPGWFRGNLHTHTLWSGGNEFPEMVLDWYRRQGYQFVFLTNHDVLGDTETWLPEQTINSIAGRPILEPYRQRFGSEWVETRETDGTLSVRLKTTGELASLFDQPGEFLVVQGEEIMAEFAGLPVHIGVGNPAEAIASRGGDSVSEVISNNLDAVQLQAERLARPILAVVNHPNRDWAITAEDLAVVRAAQFFEVYNGHPSMRNRGDTSHPSTDGLWDHANTLRLTEPGGTPLMGVATDDGSNYHGTSGASPGRGSVFVRAPELSPAALIAAMEAGDFYASTGVVLERLDFVDGVLSLVIAADRGARFVTRFIGTRKGGAVVGEVFATVQGRSPSYRTTGDELYVRAVVTSSELMHNPMPGDQPKMAWTQPAGWRR